MNDIDKIAYYKVISIVLKETYKEYYYDIFNIQDTFKISEHDIIDNKFGEFIHTKSLVLYKNGVSLIKTSNRYLSKVIYGKIE